MRAVAHLLLLLLQVLLKYDVIARMTSEDDVKQRSSHPGFILVSVHDKQITLLSTLPLYPSAAVVTRSSYSCAAEK